jgi:hypothetical protein
LIPAPIRSSKQELERPDAGEPKVLKSSSALSHAAWYRTSHVVHKHGCGHRSPCAAGRAGAGEGVFISIRLPIRGYARTDGIWLGGFLRYSLSRWTELLLTNRFPQLTHELSVAMLAASLACFVGWGLMLNRGGEKEIVVI